MSRKFEYWLLNYPSGHSDLDTMHTSKHFKKKKKRNSYPNFDAQYQSDTENEFVSTKVNLNGFPTLSLV